MSEKLREARELVDNLFAKAQQPNASKDVRKLAELFDALMMAIEEQDRETRWAVDDLKDDLNLKIDNLENKVYECK